MNFIRAIEKNKRTFSMISIQFLVFKPFSWKLLGGSPGTVGNWVDVC